MSDKEKIEAIKELFAKNEPNYTMMKRRMSEDLIPARKSWEEMKDYADEQHYLLQDIRNILKNEEEDF